MQHKYLVIMGILFLGAGKMQAQDSYKVLGWKAENTWHKYLIQRMHEQYGEREEDIEQAFTSAEDARLYREKIRREYEKIKGSFPPLSPLDARSLKAVQRSGYRIEKIVYESFSNHHVTANLYIPDGEKPFPGVLLFCGHEREAKATPSYQKTAILLARHGFVVLVIDPISQAERFQLTNENGTPSTRGGTTEHTLLNAGSNLVGTNVVNYEYWDNKRGLDYLLTRPEVDTTRIGVLGNSGGGTMTTYFLGLNDKPQVAVPCSYVTKRERAIEVLGPQDGCQWVPFEGRQHLEIDDFLLMHAPIPTLLLAGKYDFVDFVGVKSTYSEMKDFYAALHRPEDVGLFSWADGHGISKPKREAAVKWFRRWFYQDSSRVQEGDLDILSEHELQVTKTGQVNSSFPGEYTIWQRNIDLADDLKTKREAFRRTHSTDEFRAKLWKLLGTHPRNEPVKPEVKGHIDHDSYRMEKIILRRKGQVPVPALVIYPSGAGFPGRTVVWFPEQGKQSVASKEKLLKSYVRAGDAVVIADLRGTGETEDPAEFNDAKYYDNQYRNDQISLHIGEPVVGQRVQDIETVLNFIRKDEKLPEHDINVYATGINGAPALHAAALDGGIHHLYLENTIRSYMDILHHPTMKNAYAYVIPDALKYYDLPDLVDLVGPENVSFK